MAEKTILDKVFGGELLEGEEHDAKIQQVMPSGTVDLGNYHQPASPNIAQGRSLSDTATFLILPVDTDYPDQNS